MPDPTKQEELTLEWLKENTPTHKLVYKIRSMLAMPDLNFEAFRVEERKPYGTWSEYYVRVWSMPLVSRCGILNGTAFKDVRIHNFGGSIKFHKNSENEPDTNIYLTCWVPVHFHWEHFSCGTNGTEWFDAVYEYAIKKWTYRNRRGEIIGEDQC